MNPSSHTKLSVNINKIALLRNSRGTNLPDLLNVALDCIRFGAEGITVHPRPDERHIRKSDIPILVKNISVEFNIEGYPSKDFIRMVLDNHPDQVSLVPDPPDVLTSDSGWDTKAQLHFLQQVVRQIKSEGIRVSLFMDPDLELIRYAADTGADRIELYTGHYSHQYNLDRNKAIEPHILASQQAAKSGLALNAGHDLNLFNLQFYKESVINLVEVSIGHALVCDALYFGLQNAIIMYRKKLE
ncbi:MAG: pyridoxine 5'-phosphate synthase [Saprospiraceae bacterium]|nr:pyridoxine 5'-phosphate synthase [Saprospiraceae bacterium]